MYIYFVKELRASNLEALTENVKDIFQSSLDDVTSATLFQFLFYNSFADQNSLTKAISFQLILLHPTP